MTYGIKRKIRIALDNASYTIRSNAQSGGRYGSALSNEGFAGGYQAALYDVQMALNGVVNNNSNWWPGSERGDAVTEIRATRQGDAS